MADKIKFSSDEKLYKEGAVVYLKSTLNVIQGTGYLTSKRFVFCKRSGLIFFLLGPLLMHFTKGKQIVFEIPLQDIVSIGGGKHGLGKKYTIKTKRNEEFSIQFTLGADKWLAAIQDAVKAAVSGAQVKAVGDLIEFT